MLKHVQTSSSSLSPYRLKWQSKDTVSLNSSLSYGSSGVHELSSRSSSTSSLQDSSVPPQKTTVRIFSKVLCADMEYKTLSIDQSTTSSEVIKLLLSKFKMKHRDPKLFFLTMEVWIRKKGNITFGIPIRSIILLEDEAHPAQLQACHPRGESKFALKMRRGGLVKVFGGSCLMAGSLYKSLLISDRTTVEDLIQLVLFCYSSNERSTKFALYEVCANRNYERKLHSNDLPLQVQQEWTSTDRFAFHLRRNVEALQRRQPWPRDTPGNLNLMYRSRSVTMQSLLESDNSFNTYENCFFI